MYFVIFSLYILNSTRHYRVWVCVRIILRLKNGTSSTTNMQLRTVRFISSEVCLVRTELQLVVLSLVYLPCNTIYTEENMCSQGYMR